MNLGSCGPSSLQVIDPAYVAPSSTAQQPNFSASNVVNPGKHYNRDGDRQLVNGEASHYSRARANLDAMLTSFEGIALAMGSEKLPPEVVVRFGHATHTTPEQAVRMAKLGIIAEVNLASNVQTGSLNQGEIRNGADQHRGREAILAPHVPNERGHALSANVAETPASPKISVEGDRGMHDDKSDGEADRGLVEGAEAPVHDGREDQDPARGRHRCARDRWGERAATA